MEKSKSLLILKYYHFHNLLKASNRVFDVIETNGYISAYLVTYLIDHKRTSRIYLIHMFVVALDIQQLKKYV